MAVFTKTYVQCDLCEQQRELPANGDGWYRCEANISKLGASNSAGDKVSTRTTDICASCFGAIQDGEFSNLFFADKSSNGAKPAGPKIAPVS